MSRLSATAGRDGMETGVVIVGAGAAGLLAALEAARQGAPVLVVSKGRVGRSGGSICAFPTIQCPLGHEDPTDSPESFARDVVRMGRYLANQKLVSRVAEASVEAIATLARLGVPFEKTPDGRFRQIQFVSAASHPRVMSMPNTPLCGPPICIALTKAVCDAGVEFLEDAFLLDLVVQDGAVAGCLLLDLRSGRLTPVRASQVILATGALADCYQYSYFPRDATGDGHAAALRAGASLVDMEFVHFYETVLYPESVRGVNFHTPGFQGEGIRPPYNTVGEDLPTQIEGSHLSTRVLLNELRKGTVSERGGVYFDTGAIPAEMYQRVGAFESGRYLPQLGVQQIELGLGTFFVDGGVQIDENCQAGPAGLYAVGDTAGGFNGAQYFGGCGVTFALSSGLIAGRAAGHHHRARTGAPLGRKCIQGAADRLADLVSRQNGDQSQRACHLKAELQSVMTRHVGPVRDRAGLHRAISQIQSLKETPVTVASTGWEYNPDLIEALHLRNLLDTSLMVAQASLLREESRGDLRRSDCPDELPNWLKNIIFRQGAEGQPEWHTQPVDLSYFKPADEEGH